VAKRNKVRNPVGRPVLTTGMHRRVADLECSNHSPGTDEESRTNPADRRRASGRQSGLVSVFCGPDLAKDSSGRVPGGISSVRAIYKALTVA